jgi:hypothetical protein
MARRKETIQEPCKTDDAERKLFILFDSLSKYSNTFSFYVNKTKPHK